MGVQADSNRQRLVYKVESTWNETPTTGTMIELRNTGQPLQHQKTTKQSAEIRSDQQIPFLAEVGVQAGGPYNFELSHTEYDPFLEGALGAAFIVTTHSAVNLQAIAASNKFVRATGSWVTDGFVAGQWFKSAGFTNAANNSFWFATSVTATDLVVAQTGVIVDEASAASRTITGKYLRNGTAKKSFLLERQSLDIGKYLPYTGMRVGQLSLNVQSEDIVTGSFQFTGAKGLVSSGTSLANTVTASTTNPVMNATANIGALYEGAFTSTLAVAVKGLNLSVNRNLRAQKAIANKASIGVGYGSLVVTGQINPYFEDEVLYNKFINHTQSLLSFRVTDSGGKIYIFTMPALFYSDGNPDGPGLNSDIMQNMAFQAIRDPTYGYTIQIDSF